ncbi:hypothetical protein [Myroides indicus]|uniref:Uncharacterized protein n=1 Tax=Myroides indicus TaxID=1323422 RepID=A0A4R7FAC4_9FLAO|nr:hypothetical protein [Myroides indicus]TDS64255.1 hypothetical protein C8P70_105104 [Myroides indicus]
MTKTTRLLFRALGIMLIVLWSLGIKAQTAHNPVLTWDQEVGCIEYDSEGQDQYKNLYEQISLGVCIRVCGESTVNYSFSANDVVSVEWQATGGTV